MSNRDRSWLSRRSRGQQCNYPHEILFPHCLYASSSSYGGDDWHDGDLSHSSNHTPACSDGPVTGWRAGHLDGSLRPPETAHPGAQLTQFEAEEGWRYSLGSPTCPSAPPPCSPGCGSLPSTATGRIRTPNAALLPPLQGLRALQPLRPVTVNDRGLASTREELGFTQPPWDR
jgi:hypothetical protein